MDEDRLALAEDWLSAKIRLAREIVWLREASEGKKKLEEERETFRRGIANCDAQIAAIDRAIEGRALVLETLKKEHVTSYRFLIKSVMNAEGLSEDHDHS